MHLLLRKLVASNTTAGSPITFRESQTLTRPRRDLFELFLLLLPQISQLKTIVLDLTFMRLLRKYDYFRSFGTNSVSFDKSATAFPALVDLNVTGVDAGSGPYITKQTNSVSITSDVLTTLTTAGSINDVRLHGAAKLTSLSTSGYIRDFELIGAATLTTAGIGHDHIEGFRCCKFKNFRCF